MSLTFSFCMKFPLTCCTVWGIGVYLQILPSDNRVGFPSKLSLSVISTTFPLIKLCLLLSLRCVLWGKSDAVTSHIKLLGYRCWSYSTARVVTFTTYTEALHQKAISHSNLVVTSDQTSHTNYRYNRLPLSPTERVCP